MVRFGSVCSGIEAASLAWGSLGWEAAWLAEVEPFPATLLAQRFGATAPLHMLDPNEEGLKEKERASRRAAIKAISRETCWGDRVQNYGDMTRIAAYVARGEAESPDVLVGGTPCQSFSLAGLRDGLNDPRGRLTLAYVELLNAIDRRRLSDGKARSVAVWENVPGVLTDKENAFGNFLAGLAGEDVPLVPPGGRWSHAGLVVGPQRAVAWRVLDAQFFRLAQRRARVFVVASAREGFDPGAVLLEFEGLRRDSPPSREAREEATHPVAPCITGGGRGFARVGDPRGQDAVVATLDANYGRLQGCSGQDLGHNHSHLVVEAFGGNNQAGPIDVATARNAHSGPHGRLDFETETFVVQTGVAVFDPTQITHPDNRSNPQPGDPCHTLPARGHAPVVFSLRGREGGAMPEIEDEDVCPALRAAEGGSTRPMLAIGVDEYNASLVEDCSPTLTAAAGTAGNRKPAVMTSNLAVRRLMPIECERLQGMPDGWTDILVRGKSAADGPRYKAIGNSMAVSVMHWIGVRIDRQMRQPETAWDNLSPIETLYRRALALN